MRGVARGTPALVPFIREVLFDMKEGEELVRGRAEQGGQEEGPNEDYELERVDSVMFGTSLESNLSFENMSVVSLNIMSLNLFNICLFIKIDLLI